MDTQEARQVLENELARYESRSYQSLQMLVSNEDHYSVIAPSGTQYQIEVQALWDDLRTKDRLRVIVSVDDGSFLRACAPMCRDFLVGSDHRGHTFMSEQT